MAGRDEPIRTPTTQRVADFKQRHLPLLVWSIAALACLWLLAGRASRFEYIGLARALQYEVSASSTGRIDTLVVDVYEDVDAGDVLARIDDAEVAIRIDRSRARIRQLTAELNAAKVELVSSAGLDRADWTGELRRFQADEEERRLAAQEIRGRIETDQLELDRLVLETRRVSRLLQSGVVGQAMYEEVRLRHDQVRQRIDEKTILLSTTEEEYQTARSRREQFEASLPALPEQEPMLLPLEEAIAVEREVLRGAEVRRAALVLRSPVTGQVSSILHRRGETVVAGEPILTIAEHSVTEILAYLRETDSRGVQESSPVLVSSIHRPQKVAESIVLRMGPDVEVLPRRLWAEPSVPEYGRAVVIAAVPSLRLTPGELINVRFRGGR